MELRVLRYFLTVTREGSIARASEVLHVTQPTLSRQLHDLEEEFGAQLFTRGNKAQGITLTEKGFLLRKRAEEIVQLVDRTQEEMNTDEGTVRGDVLIGCGESDAMRIVARAAQTLNKKYPDIHYHLFSGNAEDVKERLDKGLLDFGIFIAPTDLSKYETIKLPMQDHWGLVVRADSPLAEKKSISPEELVGVPLWVSRQFQVRSSFEAITGIQVSRLTIVGTFNLIHNAALMVDEGYGCALGLDKLVPTGADSRLRFIPINPFAPSDIFIAWKKYQMQGKAAELFLGKIREFCGETI